MTNDMRKVVFDSYRTVSRKVGEIISGKDRHATASVGVKMTRVPFLEMLNLKGDSMDFYCLPAASKTLKEKIELLSEYEGIATISILGSGRKYSGGMQALIYPGSQLFVAVEGYMLPQHNDVFALLLMQEIAEQRLLSKSAEIKYAPIAGSWYREILDQECGFFLRDALRACS